MSRRRRAEKRKIPPDVKYNSELVSRLINRLMVGGKKRTAEGIVYSAMGIAAEQLKRDPEETLDRAIQNITPLLEVKPRRVAGSTYQVPVEVRTGRGLSLALRWLVTISRARKGHSMAEKLANEIADAARGQGVAVKKREDTHKMAEANRAFVHFRW